MEGVENEEKFIGTLLWDIVDLFTFGAFEKKPNKTKNCSNQSNNSN